MSETTEAYIASLRAYLKAWEKARRQIDLVGSAAPKNEQLRSVETVLLLVDEIMDNCEGLIEDLEGTGPNYEPPSDP
jgi:hypothetical protein